MAVQKFPLRRALTPPPLINMKKKSANSDYSRNGSRQGSQYKRRGTGNTSQKEYRNTGRTDDSQER